MSRDCNIFLILLCLVSCPFRWYPTRTANRECMFVNTHLEETVRSCMGERCASHHTKLPLAEAKNLIIAWSALIHAKWVADNAHLTVPRTCGAGNTGEVLAALQKSLDSMNTRNAAHVAEQKAGMARAESGLSQLRQQISDVLMCVSGSSGSSDSAAVAAPSPSGHAPGGRVRTTLETTSPSIAVSLPAASTVQMSEAAVNNTRDPPRSSLDGSSGCGVKRTLTDISAVDVAYNYFRRNKQHDIYSDDKDKSRATVLASIFDGMATPDEMAQLLPAPPTSRERHDEGAQKAVLQCLERLIRHFIYEQLDTCGKATSLMKSKPLLARAIVQRLDLYKTTTGRVISIARADLQTWRRQYEEKAATSRDRPLAGAKRKRDTETSAAAASTIPANQSSNSPGALVPSSIEIPTEKTPPIALPPVVPSAPLPLEHQTPAVQSASGMLSHSLSAAWSFLGGNSKK